MKRKKLPTPLAACLAAFFSLALPQSSLCGAPEPVAVDAKQAGSISGRVQDVDTGQYLTNARISIEGSDRQAFTDESGIFRLTDIPAGPVVLRVFYTGLPAEEVKLNVASGENTDKRIFLSRGGRDRIADRITQLDPFTVTAETELSAEALAVNEQRFAPNIKNVVAADAFGDVSEGNVGEFMKNMPGITADFADPTMVSISVRGLASNLTQVTSDGAQVASAHTGGSTRVFQFNQVSINNVSRVELTKVPTPADPADSMGGIVNLVSKSAFERKTSQLNYRLFFAGAKDNLRTDQVLDTDGKRRYRLLPSADFTYTIPVNDRFGLVVSGITANRFDERHVSARTYNATLANTAASYSNPFMQSYTLQDAPRYTYRDSVSIKADWRVTPNSVLSASFQHSGYESNMRMDQMVVNTGGNPVPTAGGTPLAWGPDYTYGATGRGALSLNGQNFDIDGGTNLGSLRYRFDNGDWQIKAGVSQSASNTHFTDTANGHFYNMTTQLFGAAGFVGSAFTIDYLDINENGPGTIRITDIKGKPVNLSDPKNYRLTAAASLPRDVLDTVRTMDASVRRRINRLPFPLAIEIGAAQRYQKRDSRLQNMSFTYNGPDGKANTNDPASPYLADTMYDTRDAGFGFKNIPWVSVAKAYDAWQANPTLFSQTAAQEVAAETYRINNSEVFEETVNAGFALVEARFIQNKLHVLTGIRYEHTTGKGQGALEEPANVWRRNPDGSFVHDNKGNKVRKPEAGAAGSLEELRLTLFEREAKAQRSYDGYYPSLHVNYSIMENLLARAAYARTYGRPNFNQIIPNAVVNDFDLEGNTDPDAVLGTITVRNPALRPWVADNYDFSLEYYTKSGGLFSAGYYLKEIDGFFQRRIKIATAEDLAELDLDPMYVGYQLSTTYNLNRGRISGYEFNSRQPLKVLGRWGKPFDVFANATLFKDISGLSGRAYNAGATFRMKPVTLGAKINYRTGRRGTSVAALGPDAYEYEGDRTTLDASFAYLFTKYLSFFASSSNVLSNDPTADRYGSETPEYAKRFRIQKFGAQYQFGIRGTF